MEDEEEAYDPNEEDDHIPINQEDCWEVRVTAWARGRLAPAAIFPLLSLVLVSVSGFVSASLGRGRAGDFGLF